MSPAAPDENIQDLAALGQSLADARAHLEDARAANAELQVQLQALLRKESLFSLVYNNVSDAIFFLAVEPPQEFRFLTINPAFTHLTGVTADQVIGRNVRKVIPQPSLALVLDHYLEAIRNKATVTWEETTEYPTGTKYGEVSVTPIFDPDGICTNLIGVVRDITERCKAEDALRRNKERLEKAQQIAHMGFLDWDLKTNELVCSDEVYRWFGVSREEAPKTPEFIERVVHPEDLGLTRQNLESAIQGGKGYDIYHRVLRPDGRVLWVHAQAELTRDAAGNPERLLGTMVDVTERRLAEEEILRLNSELEERIAKRTSLLESANKELASFSHSVSHDLRAPLRHVNGFIDLLKREAEGKLSEKGQRYLQIISDASRDMGVLIDDLLAFSRMGRVEMQERACDLNALVRATLREFKPAADGRGIEWHIAVLPEAIGDVSMLKLVFSNLIDNALKYTRPRELARIEVGTAGTEDGRIIVFVKDNGVGFDMQYADKLFGVFQRLHRPDEFEGTGIGLANVQRIISRHGGRAWAEAELGKGASFYFTLQPAPSTGTGSEEVP